MKCSNGARTGAGDLPARAGLQPGQLSEGGKTAPFRRAGTTRNGSNFAILHRTFKIGREPSPRVRQVPFPKVFRMATLMMLVSAAMVVTWSGLSAAATLGAPQVLSALPPQRPRPERGHRLRDGQGEERPHLPARGAVAPVVPRGLLAQPDQRLPERGVLGSCADRGQPEPGQAHRGVRPVFARREPVVHRALLRICGAVPGALGLICLCHPERPRPEQGRSGP